VSAVIPLDAIGSNPIAAINNQLFSVVVVFVIAKDVAEEVTPPTTPIGDA
jgi:hypothetical protein